jgi:hypothetical protein
MVRNLMSFTNTDWPRCKYCNSAIYRGFNNDRIRVIRADLDDKVYHIYKEDCSGEHPGYKGEEAEIVYVY